MFSCETYLTKNDESDYEYYLSDLRENISYVKHDVSSDTTSLFTLYNGRKIGWEYLYVNNVLATKRLWNLDTLENISYNYFPDGKTKSKEVIIFSQIEKKYILSEYCGDSFCDIITFNNPDTIYANLDKEIDFEFFLSESLKDFFNEAWISVYSFNHVGKNKAEIIHNMKIMGNKFEVRAKQYGFLIVYFEVKDQMKRTRFFRRVFHIVPSKLKTVDWTFIQENPRITTFR